MRPLGSGNRAGITRRFRSEDTFLVPLPFVARAVAEAFAVCAAFPAFSNLPDAAFPLLMARACGSFSLVGARLILGASASPECGLSARSMGSPRHQELPCPSRAVETPQSDNAAAQTRPCRSSGKDGGLSGKATSGERES